jgi:hypothetical protein
MASPPLTWWIPMDNTKKNVSFTGNYFDQGVRSPVSSDISLNIENKTTSFGTQTDETSILRSSSKFINQDESYRTVVTDNIPRVHDQGTTQNYSPRNQGTSQGYDANIRGSFQKAHATRNKTQMIRDGGYTQDDPYQDFDSSHRFGSSIIQGPFQNTNLNHTPIRHEKGTSHDNSYQINSPCHDRDYVKGPFQNTSSNRVNNIYETQLEDGRESQRYFSQNRGQSIINENIDTNCPSARFRTAPQGTHAVQNTFTLYQGTSQNRDDHPTPVSHHEIFDRNNIIGPYHDEPSVQPCAQNFNTEVRLSQLNDGLFYSTDGISHKLGGSSQRMNISSQTPLPSPFATQTIRQEHNNTDKRLSVLPNIPTHDTYFLNSNSIRHKAKEPDKFDGETTDWRDYLVHFENVANWNRWSGIEKAQQLVMSLRGSAQRLLSDLNPGQINNYSYLLTVLGRRFNPAERETAYRCEFRNRKQQKSETAADFGYALQKLCVKAYPSVQSEAREIYVIDQFINGLIKPEVRSHVQFRHPNTIHSAIALAVEFEAFEGSQGILRKPRFEPEQSQGCNSVSKKSKEPITLDDIASLLKNLTETLSKGNRSRSNSRDRNSSIECYKCHEKGHIASHCSKLLSEN